MCMHGQHFAGTRGKQVTGVGSGCVHLLAKSLHLAARVKRDGKGDGNGSGDGDRSGVGSGNGSGDGNGSMSEGASGSSSEGGGSSKVMCWVKVDAGG